MSDTDPETATAAPAATADPPPPLIDDPAVGAAIEAHAAAEVALVEAKQQLTDARAQVRNALFDAGQRYRARELPLPQPDLHRLYWDHRELRATDIANALAVTTTELARRAGPRQGYGRCDECEQLVPMLLESRSPKPVYARPSLRCDPCRDRHDAREERERQRQHELDLAAIAAGDPLPRGRREHPGPSPYGGSW